MTILRNIDTTNAYTTASTLSAGTHLVSLVGFSSTSPTWSANVAVTTWAASPGAVTLTLNVVNVPNGRYVSIPYPYSMIATVTATPAAAGDVQVVITPNTGVTCRNKFELS